MSEKNTRYWKGDSVYRDMNLYKRPEEDDGDNKYVTV